MTKITKSMVKYLCEIACIEFEDDEYDNIAKDLQSTVDSFDMLNEIPNVESLELKGIKIDAENDLREDIPKQSLNIKDIIDNAPESCGGAIVVPTVVE